MHQTAGLLIVQLGKLLLVPLRQKTAALLGGRPLRPLLTRSLQLHLLQGATLHLQG
jgi:hypothetical protein